MQPARRIRRNILHAVYRQIHALFQQRLFQFLDEDSFPANLRQRRLLHLVARRLDDDDFRFHAGKLEKLLAHKFSLPARQDAAS